MTTQSTLVPSSTRDEDFKFTNYIIYVMTKRAYNAEIIFHTDFGWWGPRNRRPTTTKEWSNLSPSRIKLKWRRYYTNKRRRARFHAGGDDDIWEDATDQSTIVVTPEKASMIAQLIKGIDVMKVTSSLVDALKPVTMIDLIRRCANCTDKGQGLQILALATEQYAGKLGEAWPAMKLIVMFVIGKAQSFARQLKDKITKDTENSEEESGASSRPDSYFERLLEAFKNSPNQAPDKAMDLKNFIDVAAAAIDKTVSGDDTVTLHAGFDEQGKPIDPTLWESMMYYGKDVGSTILMVLQKAWDMGKEVFITCGAGFMMALTAIGSLFPECKFARKCLDRFMACIKAQKTLSTDEGYVMYQALKDSVTVTVGESTITYDAAASLDELKCVLNQVDRSPHLLLTPGFPKKQISMLLKTVTDFCRHVRLADVADWRAVITRAQGMLDRRERALTTQSVRPMPVCLVLAGIPGVGKSYLVKTIAKHVNKFFSIPGDSHDAWQTTLDYQDGLEGRAVMTFEEYGLHNLEADARSLQRVVDEVPFQTNCDLIQNKGNFISPAVVIVTTNCMDLFGKMKNPEALARRIDYHIAVSNAGLEEYLKNNVGKTPTKERLAEIHKTSRSVHQQLPYMAEDWHGSHKHGVSGAYTTKYSPPLSVTPEELADKIMIKVAQRWDETMKMAVKVNVHNGEGFDTPCVVLCGPPGSGKTTLVNEVGRKDLLRFDDPFVNKESTKDCYAAILHSDTSRRSVVVTTNPTAYTAFLDSMEPDVRGAFTRRVTRFDFSFLRRGLFSWYSQKDIGQHGWAATVCVRQEGEDIDTPRLALVNMLRDIAPATKPCRVASVLTHRVAHPVVASSPLSITELSTRGVDMDAIRNFHIVPNRRTEVLKTLMNIMTQVTISRKTAHTSRTLVASFNDSNIKAEISPWAVRFGDDIINFWSSEGKMMAALVADDGGETTDLTQDVTRLISLDSLMCEKLAQVWKIVLPLMCLSVYAVGVAYEEPPPWFHSPTKDIRNETTRAGAWRMRDSPARYTQAPPPGFTEPVAMVGAWGDDAQLDYSEIIDFHALGSSVVQCRGKTGNHIGWALSHKAGIFTNSHVASRTRSAGDKVIGRSTVSHLLGSDIAKIEPEGANPYKKVNYAFGHAKVGDLLHQISPMSSGFIQTGRVREIRRVMVPGKGMCTMAVLDAHNSSEGDCGLPWVSVKGTQMELIGCHAGLYGNRVMVAIYPEQVRLHGGDTGLTMIRKTPLHGALKDETVEGLRVSERVWSYEGGPVSEDGMLRHCSQVFFTPYTQPQVSAEAVSLTKEAVKMWADGESTTPWSMTATILSLDQTTSAGPAYGCRVKSEVFNPDGSIKPQFRGTFYRGMTGPMDASCKISIKDELRPPTKIAIGGSRPIFCFNAHSVVRVKQNLGPRLARLAETAGNHPVCPGISFNGGGWSDMCDRMSGRKYFMDADFGRWDSTNGHEHLEKAIDCLCDGVPNDSKVKSDLFTMMRANTQFGPTCVGLPSGVVATAQVNCLSHVLSINNFLVKRNRAALHELGCPLTIFCYGDDIIIGGSDRSLLEELPGYWKEHGFSATSADKKGPPKVVEDLSVLSFLKRKLIKREGAWYAPLEKSSIIKSLAYARVFPRVPVTADVKPVDELPIARWVNMLQGAVTEAYQHGPVYYTDFKFELIDAFRRKNIRLPVCIPEYTRFVPRDLVLADNPDSPATSYTCEFHAGDMDIMSGPEAGAAGGGAPGEGLVVGVVGSAVQAATPTEGMAMGQTTTGGAGVMMDPTVYNRFVLAPGGLLSISSATTSGTTLFQMALDPGLNPFTAHLAQMYNAWAGGFEMLLQVGANNMLAGKIIAACIPPNLDPDGVSTIEQMTSFPHIIVDIRAMDNVILPLPDIRRVLWHMIGDNTADGRGGYILLKAFTRFLSAGTELVQFDVRIMTRPSPDFGFNFLKAPSVLTTEGGLEWYQEQCDALACPGYMLLDGSQTSMMVMLAHGTVISNVVGQDRVGLDGRHPYSVNPSSPTCVSATMKNIGTKGWGPIFYDKDARPWDLNAEGSSRTFPELFPNKLPKNRALFFYLGNDIESAHVEFVFGAGHQLDSIRIDPASAAIDGRLGTMLWYPDGDATPHGGDRDDFPWYPPNAESVVMYTRLSTSNADAFSTSTTLAATQRILRPVDMTGMCLLLAVIVNGAEATYNFKLYPNGILCCGEVRSPLVLEGRVEFRYLGKVSQAHRLAAPSSKTVTSFELERAIEEWLASSQQPSEDRPSLESLLVQGLSGLRLAQQTSQPTPSATYSRQIRSLDKDY
uniref:Genome polyprotein n=1 Tax=Wenling rattails calicivirus 2 TaxID=2116389 RepID=A0A2P1GML4_9CALI|nr:polyprotein [Wenling rattails calicivirus 2]